MPYGRGGAGNYEAAEQKKSPTDVDLEANLEPNTGQEDEQNTVHTTAGDAKYAYSGRGGAGNFYSPAELKKTGHFQDSPDPGNIGSGTGETSPESGPKVGRGGIGNILFGAGKSERDAAQQAVDLEKKEKELQRKVEEGVEEQLSAPPKAKLAGPNP